MEGMVSESAIIIRASDEVCGVGRSSVTLPFLTKLFVQLFAAGSEPLELWVDWDHQERVKIRVESQMNTSCV